MAFTDNVLGAGSDDQHSVEVEISQGEQQRLGLPDRPGDDYLEDKGDLWTIDISDFSFSDTCVTIEEIRRVSIVARDNDNWIIESIMTYVVYSNRVSQALTTDFHVHRRIDITSADISDRRFDLTFV